jgi:transposase
MPEKVKRKLRVYTNEYKIEAVKLARQMKDNKKVATELGMPVETLITWINKANIGEIDTGQGTQNASTVMTQAAEIQSLKTEMKRIEKENTRLREINEFLEEASAFFAACSQKLAKKNA